MLENRKKIRTALKSIYSLTYHIKEKAKSTEAMDKKAFIEVITELRLIEDRRDFMESEIGIDMTQYEDQFFFVIENLFKIAFSKEQLALINLYLYKLTPDDDWDGTITVEANNVEQVVKFKTPEDVWNVIKNFQK